MKYRMRKLVNVALAVFVVFVLVGCGGNGTPPIGGGGGGGGERLAASFTGAFNTEYGDGQNDSRGPLAQGFVGDGGFVTRASFNGYKVAGSPSGSFIIELQSDRDGVPSGVVLTTSDAIETTNLSATVAWQDWNFSNPNSFRTVLGVSYWLVLRKVDGLYGPGDWWTAKANTNPNSYPLGRLISKASNGTWQELGNDALFRVYTRP
ncbi:MAG: hypothetical protein AAB563_01545 [Patescibacteria group bacterium]